MELLFFLGINNDIYFIKTIIKRIELCNFTNYSLVKRDNKIHILW